MQKIVVIDKKTGKKRIATRNSNSSPYYFRVYRIDSERNRLDNGETFLNQKELDCFFSTQSRPEFFEVVKEMVAIDTDGKELVFELSEVSSEDSAIN